MNKRTFIFILTICFTFLSCNKNSDKQNRIYLEDFLTWAPCTQNSLVEEIKGNKNAFTEFKKFDENTINEVKRTTMDKGNKFPYTIEFVSVTADKATIKITKA